MHRATQDSSHAAGLERGLLYNYMGTAFGLPILNTKTALTPCRIPMGLWHIFFETAFIKINDGFSLFLVALYFFLEPEPGGFVRFGMTSRFC